MANYYLCPKPFDSQNLRPDAMMGWAKEFLQQGNSYLRQQPAFKYIQEGIDIVNLLNDNVATTTLSNVKLSSTLRNLKELIAAQTNIRVIPAFGTEIAQYSDTSMILNKMYMAWQTATFADRALRKVWQYAGACGTGYLGIRWEPNYWYKGKGDIALDAYGPLDIIPVGLPRSHNIQQAYGVAIKVETPIHEVLRRYPLMQDKIAPTRGGSSIGKGEGVASSVVRYASAALARFGQGSISNDSEHAPWPVVDLYHIYVDDDSINYTGKELEMGTPGTSWFYRVPFIGQRIPMGMDARGHQVFREAKPEDCLIYPNRRKIVCTPEHCLTPDPSLQVNEFWHGKVPVTQWRADDWPWNFLGTPLTVCGASLEKANNSMMRGMVDAFNVKLSPPRAYDKQSMSEALAQTINTRIPNQVVGLNMSLTGERQITPLLPAEYYQVPNNALEFVANNESRIKEYMGVADASALARARQMPSSDSVEKMMEVMGPLIKDQTRNMESSVRDNGEMWKSNAFQFYTAARRFQVLGPDGLVSEDFDFKPTDMVPDKVDGLEDKGRFEIAKHHSGLFSFNVTPYSLHEMNSVTRKLFHLQLERSGFPISWWTLAQVFDIKNFGNKPMMDDPDTGESRECETELELWLAEMEIKVKMQQAMQPPPPTGAGGGGAPGSSAQPAAPPIPGLNGPHAGGRPPTGQNPPALEMKSDGRSTIRETKK